MLGNGGELVGILPWSSVLAGQDAPGQPSATRWSHPMAVAYPDEILRTVADRMAALGLGVHSGRRPRPTPNHLEGLITQFDLLQARQKLLEEERHAERVLTLRRVSSATRRYCCRNERRRRRIHRGVRRLSQDATMGHRRSQRTTSHVVHRTNAPGAVPTRRL